MIDIADWQPPFTVGERFSRELMFDSQTVMDFARAAHDPNPLHLDKEVAAASRFGGLIASGTHSMSWLLGTIGVFVGARCDSLGLEFTFKLRRAVPADQIAIASWEVVSITPKPSLKGYLMVMSGKLTNTAGEVLVAGEGKIVVMPGIP